MEIDKVTEEIMTETYNKVIEKISGSSIFGYPVKMDDIKMIIIAAYLAGTTSYTKFPELIDMR